MTSSALRRSLVALLAAAPVVACASASTAGGQSAPQPAATSGASNAPASGGNSNSSARKAPHPADVRFMSAMIGHHSQALVMAGWAPSHGASQSVRILAERIVSGQKDEIASMQQWLRERGQPVPDGKATSMRMVMNGMEHDMPMPGMLSDAQMKELEAARGGEFDRLFLQYMIQHHRGATSMVTELFATDGAAQEQSVFKLASDVNVDQTTEIERMQKMLVPLLMQGRKP